MSGFSERFGPWGLVTGAAQGVGLAFAEELLERGLGVVLVDRNPSVVAVANGLDGDTRAVVADLTDLDWLATVESVVADLEIGLAVANAGVSFVGYFLNMTPAERRAMLRVNTEAIVELAAWALPPMVERGRGGFVIITSGSAIAGTGGVGLYSATKAFGLSLAEAVGWELRDTGVVTQAVVAPTMATPMFLSQPVDHEKMMIPAVDPRTVVVGALDALGNDTMWLADEGLKFMASIPRREAVGIISEATTSMYPTIFPHRDGDGE